MFDMIGEDSGLRTGRHIVVFASNIRDGLRKSLFFVFANVSGMFSYIALDYWITKTRPEEDAFNTFDIIHFWLTNEFPLLLFFFVLNAAWCIQLTRCERIEENKNSLLVLRLVCFLWVPSLLFFGVAIGMLLVLIAVLSNAIAKLSIFFMSL